MPAAAQPPGERRRLVSSELQDANSRARLRKLAINAEHLREFDQPVQAEIEFDLANGQTTAVSYLLQPRRFFTCGATLGWPFNWAMRSRS